MTCQVVTFADLVQRGSLLVNDGYRTKSEELGRPGIPILRVAEVQDGHLSPSFGDHVRDEFRGKIGVKTSEPRDVVLTTKGTVGRVARIPAVGPVFVYSPQVCFFRVIDRSLDPRWLYYWFHGSQFRGQAAGVQSQTDMAAYINLADLRAMTLSLPSVPEQRGIAATLGALDDKIESNRRLSSLLEDEAQTLFDVLFNVDQDDAGVAISALVNVNPSRRLRRGVTSTYIGMADLPSASSSIMSWDAKRFASGQRFMNGDVLMARITPSLENGKTAVVDLLADGEVGWGSTEFVVLGPQNDFTTPWVYCLARTESVRNFAIRNMSGTSGRERFPASALDVYRIALPPTGELTSFNAVALPNFAKITQLRNETLVLSATRDVLLPELLSGRLRVPEAMEAVAEVVDVH